MGYILSQLKFYFTENSQKMLEKSRRRFKLTWNGTDLKLLSLLAFELSPIQPYQYDQSAHTELL